MVCFCHLNSKHESNFFYMRIVPKIIYQYSRGSVKPMAIMLMLVGLVILGLGSVKFLQIRAAMQAGARMGPPPQGVTTTFVSTFKLKSSIQVVGTLNPSQGVTLSAEEDGKVARINFESGADVSIDTILVELDTSVEEAQLQSAQARLELARINLKRVQTLLKESAISEQSLNNAVSEEQAADGDVKAIKGIIARKHISAPFSGRAGIRLVNVGQYLKRGDPVVPLHGMDPMFLDFSVPERYLADLKRGQKVQFSVDVYPDEKFEGEITATDPQVNPDTRNFKVQAVILNSEEKLRPGMFARVAVFTGEEREVIAIPGTAINYAPYGNSVYLVEKMQGPAGEYEGAKQQFVSLGLSFGDLIEVTNGLSLGQQIVTSGTFKLANGIQLIINNKVMPSGESNPTVDNT